MAGRLANLRRSLELRLLLPLALTIGTVLVLHALLTYRSMRTRFRDLVASEVVRSASLIQGATHDGMLLNQLDRVQTTIERLSAMPEFEAIRVYANDGRVVLADRMPEIGHAAADGACTRCHEADGAAPPGPDGCTSLARADGGADLVRHLAMIRNEPACAAAGCHPPTEVQPVLGLLEVEMSLAPFDAALSEAQAQLVRTSAALLLLSAGVSGLFIRRVVHAPTRALHRGTLRIAAGDLDTHIRVDGGHELAELGDAFNRMVDELRAARAEVLASSERLEEKVVERTEALRRAQRQVVHMEKMASLGKLSATVAHELNNPITGMLTYARLVRRELAAQPLDSSVRDELVSYLMLMDQECARCGNIVHNLLTFARRTGADMADTDLGDAVERALMLVRHHCEMAGIAVRREADEGDATVIADAGQVQQALVALLINATEAMRARTGTGPGGTLTVRLRPEADAVEIEVADTGVGIAPEHLPHIFEPFYSTKEGEGGVGLGLAVVYGIVQRHGGSIDVASRPGEGARFVVRLPRRPPPASRDADGAAAAVVAAALG